MIMIYIYTTAAAAEWSVTVLELYILFALNVLLLSNNTSAGMVGKRMK
jgi:hypothetical protein